MKVALSNAVVGLMHDYTGRGPTRARAYIDGDLAVVVLRETMTTAEVSLVANGEGRFVLDMRRRVQAALSDDAIEAVEAVTGRKVIAFMSDNHLDPDIAAEVFLLAPVEATGDNGHASAEDD